MPWYMPWTDFIKKRACRYLLQHYLGHFFKEKLSLDQLSIDLFNGTGNIQEIQLDVVALNSALETASVPLEIVDGFVGSIHVSIPWSALLKDNTQLEVKNLEVTLKPKGREDAPEVDVMLDSMFTSMTTSLQLAEECLNQAPTAGEKEANDATPFEGLEKFAGTIEAVLSNVKVVLLDTVIRLEHAPSSQQSSALELRIKRVEYFDELAVAKPAGSSESSRVEEGVYHTPAVARKRLTILGVDIFSDLDSSQGGLMAASGASLRETEPTQIGTILGSQNVLINIKQKDEAPGPKVDVSLSLGNLNLLLSPKLLRGLQSILGALSQPGTPKSARKSSHTYPLKGHHYEQIEEELHQQLLQPVQELELDSDEDQYFGLCSASSGGPKSGSSSMTSSFTSRSSSTGPPSPLVFSLAGLKRSTETPFQSMLPPSARNRGSKRRQRQRDSLKRISDDPKGELTHLRLKSAFVAAILLHNEPPPTPSDGIDPEVPSSEKLKTLCSNFFSQVRQINTSGLDLAGDIREEYTQLCPLDHLCFLGKPVTLDSVQKSTKRGYSWECDVTVGVAELIEVLHERNNPAYRQGIPEPYPLVTFSRDVSDLKTTASLYSSMHIEQSSCIKIGVKCLERRKGEKVTSSTEIDINLSRCRIEFDLSITDRLHALFRGKEESEISPEFGASAAGRLSPTSSHRLTSVDESVSITTDAPVLSVSSMNCTLMLRFPVPDLRTTPDRLPWWRRSLRQEVLLLDMTNLVMKTTLEGSLDLLFACSELHGLFQESLASVPVSFARVTSSFENGALVKPTFRLKMNPESHTVLEPDFAPMNKSPNVFPFEPATPEPSAFSARRSMYDNEEMVLPAEREEMAALEQRSRMNTLLLMEFSLPLTNIVLPNKSFYELLYNRFVNDLLMWESLVPAPASSTSGVNQAQATDLARLMALPPLPINPLPSYDDSTDSENDIREDQYFSIINPTDKRTAVSPRPSRRQGHRQCQSCVKLNIGRGRMTLNYKADDVPHQAMQLDLQKASLFVVGGYDGDPNLSYICFRIHSAALLHNGAMKEGWVKDEVEVEEYSAVASANEKLRRTIYANEPGVSTDSSAPKDQDMVALGVKARYDAQRRVKEFVVSVSVVGATLQQSFCPPGQSCFDTLLTFFDVVDYPIFGYTQPPVVTELHCHLWDCCVDYRPLNLPLRAFLTVKSFSICSNIITGSNTSLLRFLADDAGLYLSDDVKATSVDLRNNYVCVADVGNLELSMRCNDNREPKLPKLDLRASSNIIHIRTCSDSARALADLIIYLANQGDLGPAPPPTPPPEMQESLASTVSSGGVAGGSLSASSLEQMHNMVADAMRESSEESPTTPSKSGSKETFCFPDEKGAEVASGDVISEASTESAEFRSSTESPMPHLDEDDETGNPTWTEGAGLVVDVDHFADSASGERREEPKEEFCIVDDPGLGTHALEGESKVRILVNQPLTVVDDYFPPPVGQMDQLSPPEHFPKPVFCYRLNELSLVWYIYGGRDFASTPSTMGRYKPASPKQPPKRGGQQHQSERQTHKGSFEKNLGVRGWQARGGADRNVDVLMELQLSKVRLSYEAYPQNVKQSSRQVVIVQEIEIRDRLASSNINKFLYQYTSEHLPKQSHANMVLVKALHVRPQADLTTEECTLKVSMLPIRLNIDQDALFFLRSFFCDIAGQDGDDELADERTDSKDGGSAAARPLSPPPVLQLGECILDLEEERNRELQVMFDELDTERQDVTEPENEQEKRPIYFKTVLFSPDVPIRLDYQGKRVDLQHGALAGLLAGVAQLNRSELRLKRICHRHGLLGIDKLVMFILREWLQDIRNNQLHTILGGVGPFYSLVQLVMGVRDLFWLPVVQYRKDGRIVRGLQRGAESFSTSTAMAALELTNRLVKTIQYCAEVAFDMVSPGPSVRNKKRLRKFRAKAHPRGLREGVNNAVMVVKEGFEDTANRLVAVAKQEHEEKGVTGAVGGVLRQIPPTALQPVLLATEAASSVLGGMRNQLRPDRRREDEDKYRNSDED